MAVASRALEVTEAQYQNEVRLTIANLHAAFVDVLTAHRQSSLHEKERRGLERIRAGPLKATTKRGTAQGLTSIKRNPTVQSRL